MRQLTCNLCKWYAIELAPIKLKMIGMIENPFAILERRLNRLESLLLSIKEGQTSLGENTSPQEKPLSVDEAADLLRLRKPTVYGLVSQGAIPYSKKGKRLYFSKAELTEWVKSGRKKTNDEIQAEAEAELATLGRRAR